MGRSAGPGSHPLAVLYCFQLKTGQCMPRLLSDRNKDSRAGHCRIPCSNYGTSLVWGALADSPVTSAMQISQWQSLRPVLRPPLACKQEKFDAVIVDTAGRLQIDDKLMGELAAAKKVCSCCMFQPCCRDAALTGTMMLIDDRPDGVDCLLSPWQG